MSNEAPKLHEYRYILKNGEETTEHEWAEVLTVLLDLVTGNQTITFFTDQDDSAKTFTIVCD